MRKLVLLTIAALALAGLPLSTTLAAPIPQNDAGSGADAPDSRQTALAIGSAGTFRGTLTPPADAEDWYRFQVSSPTRLTLTFAIETSSVQGAASLGARVDLVTPDGKLATFGSAEPGESASLDAVAKLPGAWYVRVHVPSWSYETGGAYRFTLGSAAPLPHAEVVHGDGYLMFGYEFGPKGGSIDYRVTEVLTTDGSHAQAEVHHLDAALDGYWSRYQSSANGQTRLTVSDEDVQVSPLEDQEGSRMRSTGYGTKSGAGVQYLLVLVKGGSSAFMSIEAKLTGDVKPLGFSRGGPQDLVALAHANFTGETVVNSPLVRAGDVAATATVATRFFGAVDCGSAEADCRVSDPDGRVTQVPGGYLEIPNGAPGTYGFALREEASFAADFFIVFGADLRLPGGR